MRQRFAIYYAPAAASPLWRLATQWLGRDPLTGAMPEVDVAGAPFARRHPLTASARRYGFHATLKAPMALDGRLEGKDLDRALKAWAGVHGPVEIGPLSLAPIGGFLALVPAAQPPALTDFAAEVVADFDDFRAPPAPGDRERRVAAGGLSARQIDLLDAYGYPYVMDEFRFHMTLTDNLGTADQAALSDAAARWFAPAIGADLLLDRLVLFHEAEPGAAFRRLRDYPLAGVPS